MLIQQGACLACFLVSICVVLFTNPTHAASTQIPSTQELITQHSGSEYTEGELLVKFRTGTSEEEKASVHRSLGSTVLRVFRSIGVEHVKLREGLSVEEAIKLYMNEPNVEYAEPNYKAGIQEGSQ